MKRLSSDPILSAVFVDYDNIYLSLKRKNEQAASRFAKDAGKWLGALQSGALITANMPTTDTVQRRTVMNRCYGNPVPRRNQSDNSTDMNSFPFVRHHFLRSGFEIIDCPPLTAQLKNSSDIKMVMDLRDFLTHETYFDEFIILSSDADFTPVLHRLRAHNRRTVIFANDNTAVPYTAIADAEVREADLISLLLGELMEVDAEAEAAAAAATEATQVQVALPAVESEPERAAIVADAPAASDDEADAPDAIDQSRSQIIALIAEEVRTAPAPLSLEMAAERATRVLGHEQTVGTDWGGAGSFIQLLRTSLPNDVKLSAQNPPVLYDQSRVRQNPPRPSLPPLAADAPSIQVESKDAPAAEPAPEHRAPTIVVAEVPAMAAEMDEPAAASPQLAQDSALAAEGIQRSIARIHDASQAPPLSPPDYRILFEEMANEISENDLQGVQTISNVMSRIIKRGTEVPKDSIRFALDVVGGPDPWFEQGATADLFSGRFRNFVVQRCRSQGLALSRDELDLIDAWFAGTPAPQGQQRLSATDAPHPTAGEAGSGDWFSDTPAQIAGTQPMGADDMPRVLRNPTRI
ncbi:MAG: NYN domain-containing protein [Pseudomonadota bacterium]